MRTLTPPVLPEAAPVEEAASPGAVRRRGWRPPSTATLLGLVLALIVWILELRPLIDNSFLIHLETGHWILDHRAVPSSDLFSFTAQGVPWVVQSWLASVVYAAIDQAVGPFGLQVLRAATCALITFLVFLLALRLAGDRTRATLLAFAATGMSITVWAERPLLQGVLAMVVLIWVVEMPDSFVGRHPLAVVPPLMWLWANFHGSFALGFAYLALHLVGRGLDGARPTRGRERALLTATGVALVACLVNPLGLTLLTFPVELLSRGDTLAHIREWRSPDFHSVMGMLFALWIATFVIGIARGKDRCSRRDLLVSLVFLLLAFWALRNLVVAPLVGLPIVARACAVPERRPDRRPLLNWVVLVLFVGLGLTGFVQAAGAKHYDFSDYPVKAYGGGGATGPPRPAPPDDRRLGRLRHPHLLAPAAGVPRRPLRHVPDHRLGRLLRPRRGEGQLAGDPRPSQHRSHRVGRRRAAGFPARPRHRPLDPRPRRRPGPGVGAEAGRLVGHLVNDSDVFLDVVPGRYGAPMAMVHRSARVGLRGSRGQRRRCFGLLRSGGDVWGALIDLNQARFVRRAPPVANYQALCREVAGVAVGELSVTAIRSVVRRYSEAFFETARRKRRGERARYPRRKRALIPLRWYQGTFSLSGRHLGLSVARGCPPLVVRLARELPYSAEAVRSVTLLAEGGRLFVHVTAALPVEDHDLDPSRIGGVDLGIIHPVAVAAGDEALIVSGRAVRAEERLHLEDTKRRGAHLGRKAPRRGQRGSRRWRRLRTAQRKAEARHRRKVRQAHHQAAKTAVAWAVQRQVGTLVIGHPKGIRDRSAGRIQNRRLSTWRFAHLLGAVRDKAEQAGITVVTVDERGTSSTCPECRRPAPKPKGRHFSCPHCRHQGHRDIVGARNIAARGGGTTTAPTVVTHRRAGKPPARRDRRRQLYDERRSGPAPGRPPPGGSRSLGSEPPRGQPPNGPAQPAAPANPARIADITKISARVH